jgi:peptidoglycan hydrolase CwlO-like protein
MKYLNRWVIFIVVAFIFLFGTLPAHAQTPPDDLEQKLQDTQNQIIQLTNQLSLAQNQEKSLKGDLENIDNQTKLTELKIQSTQYQIKKLGSEISDLNGRIDRLSGTVDKLSNLLLNRIVSTYKFGNYDTLDMVFTSNGFADLLSRLKYIQIIQENDKKVLYQLQATKADYNDQKTDKTTREAQQIKLQKDLQSYQVQLSAQKQEKQDLLAETQNNEANYQKLLAQARAQLASLAGFADSRSNGSPSIIPHTDLSDSWGKYYNQRDSNWGKNFIGLSSEQIWEVGCLMTSFAMVSTHFGSSVTPTDVAGNIDNFSLGTAFFKIPGPSANGHSSDYVTNPSMDSLRSEVRAGHPVIAGLSSNGGPYPKHYSDHWVVLRDVNSDGGFIINDPWYEGGMNVPFSQHYAGWAIIEARIFR